MAKRNRSNQKLANKRVIKSGGSVKVVTKRGQPESGQAQKKKEKDISKTDAPIVSQTTVGQAVERKDDSKIKSTNIQDVAAVKDAPFSKGKRKKVLLACILSAITVCLAVVIPIIVSAMHVDVPIGLTLKDNMLTWQSSSDADYYIVDINGTKYTTENTFFDISELLPNTYHTSICAIKNDNTKSKYSDVFTFVQEKPMLTVSSIHGVRITKVYDGNNNFNDTLKLGEHYKIEDSLLKYGKDVDINIIKAEFNSPNVTEADRLSVSFVSVLKGESAQNYKIEAGKLILEAKILPKQLQINPPSFAKQFSDKDNLSDTVIDKELNHTFDISYTRKLGEDVGVYDITGAVSTDSNYVIAVDENSGKDKFEIVQKVIDIQGAKNAFVTKTYDGSKSLPLASIDKSIYTISNVVSGYDVDIQITQAIFESEDVSQENVLTVYYSGKLIDANGVYKTLKSTFEVVGCIEPKTVEVMPERFNKEFGNDECLTRIYHDNELDQDIEIEYERAAGEAVGFYDITAVKSSSLNYVFEIVEGSGVGKFEICKRLLTVCPTDVFVEKSYDGNVIYNGGVTKNVHYTIDGEISGFEVNVRVLGAYFNRATVSEATQVTVEIDETLLGYNDIYRIEIDRFLLSAKINPKKVDVEPQECVKQYGDTDEEMKYTYYDEEINETVELLFGREAGEAVGQYDIISVINGNNNYEFSLKNSSNKYSIVKRTISISAKEKVVSKVFDNTKDCNISIKEGTHYSFSNTVSGELPTIEIYAEFNSSDVFADHVIIHILGLSDYADRYVLNVDSIVIPAQITKKQLTIVPQQFSVQYGDEDCLRQVYNDTVLDISVSVSFSRTPGNEAGDYDIVSAVSDNPNYEFTVEDGTQKYVIAPRVLGIAKEDYVFEKTYDGTTKCDAPISQGVHYNLTNLIGGSNVNLTITNQEFNSKNVDADKVIVRYTARLDGEDSGNFVAAGGTMVFRAAILPREMTVNPIVFNKDYLEDCRLEQDIFDEVSGERIRVTYSSTAGEDLISKDCGSYDITDVRTDDTNHTVKLEDGSGIGKLNINRIALKINAANSSTVYSSAGQGINAPVATPTRSLRVLYKLQSGEDSAFTTELPVNAGVYTARIIFDGDTNYLPQYIERSLRIDRANSTIVNTTPTNYIYDGTVKPITATVNHSEAEPQISRNSYVNAGTYNYILISVPQTQNYNASSITVSLTIAKRVLYDSDIAFPTASDLTYGQYLYSSTLSGGSSLGSFAWANANIKPLVSDKQFLVKFTPFDLNNYDWSNVKEERMTDINVNKFIVNDIVFPTAGGVVYTNALSTSELIGTSVYGSFSWYDAFIKPKESGRFNVVFTPYDDKNYDFTSIVKTQSVYVEVSYKTLLQTNGGSEIAPMIVKQITAEPFTYREGYVFDGWYLDETLIQKAEFPMNISRETVLYAGWYSEGLIFISHDTYYSVKLDSANVGKSIFIPSVYRDLPVTVIENSGFSNCTALEIIVIPKSVVTIGHNAFEGCYNLAFVQIINDIENINYGKDWINSGYKYGTDVYFNAEACSDCDGTIDFHQSGCQYDTDLQEGL